MYQEFGPLLKKPSDDAKIWRYIDIAKLISMLDKKQLYFSNTSGVIDPYEGTLAEYNRKYEVRREKFDHILQELNDVAFESLLLSPPPDALEIYKDRLLVNCWHLNDVESAAMWDLYSNTKTGIAVQSTFRRTL